MTDKDFEGNLVGEITVISERIKSQITDFCSYFIIGKYKAAFDELYAAQAGIMILIRYAVLGKLTKSEKEKEK